MTPPPAIYESLAPFADAFRHDAAALLYHRVEGFRFGVKRRGLSVSPRTFRNQMRELRDAGFHSSSTGSFAPGIVVISFDDGFASTLHHAAPILRECGFTAINFLVSGRIGRVNTWDLPDGERAAPLMDEAQIRDWLALGHQIGAHSVTHPHLTRLSRAAAHEEIAASRKTLEDRFGRAVPDFAYPFGEFDPAIRDLVAAAGYERAWTVQPAVIAPDGDPLALPRFPGAVSLRRPRHLLHSLLPSRS